MSANEDLRILAEDIVDYCNAVEAACVKLKMQIDRNFGPEPEQKPNWNPEKIKWVKAEGTRGSYERYPAQDQKPEATADYKNLLQDLKEHKKNFLFRDGLNYWLFQDAVTIGRKPKA